jgi:hypothetical protein
MGTVQKTSRQYPESTNGRNTLISSLLEKLFHHEEHEEHEEKASNWLFQNFVFFVLFVGKSDCTRLRCFHLCQAAASFAARKPTAGFIMTFSQSFTFNHANPVRVVSEKPSWGGTAWKT